MRAKLEERQVARDLRATGMSIRRIANHLGVALSSVSVWVRDVPVPKQASAAPPNPEPEPPQVGDRVCARCRLRLPLTAFNRSGDGRQHWCRTCFKSYFSARGELHREQVRSARRLRREAARGYILAYLRDSACSDCGLDDCAVLEFDHHTGKKTRSICELVAEAAGVDRLARELKLCEVVCASCHRRRTARRGSWFRVTRVPRPTWTRGQTRNHALLLERLRQSGCVDCGERDPVVLEFDHIRDKRGDVTKLANHCSVETLEHELAKCVVRCVNCHRRRSLSDAGAWRLAG